MDGGSAGDARAITAKEFERLFRAHGDQILRFFLRRTGDWALAEDLRSAVFYEAWRRRREIDLTRRDALPWLYGVAGNLIRNHRRSVRRREAAMRRLPPQPSEPDAVEEIASRVDAHAKARDTLDFVKTFPPHERDVVVLCLARRMSYSDAAAELGVPVGTVRSRLFRARARLELLARDDPCRQVARRTSVAGEPRGGPRTGTS